jgi:hypothetical protein
MLTPTLTPASKPTTTPAMMTPTLTPASKPTTTPAAMMTLH